MNNICIIIYNICLYNYIYSAHADCLIHLKFLAHRRKARSVCNLWQLKNNINISFKCTFLLLCHYSPFIPMVAMKVKAVIIELGLLILEKKIEQSCDVLWMLQCYWNNRYQVLLPHKVYLILPFLVVLGRYSPVDRTRQSQKWSLQYFIQRRV